MKLNPLQAGNPCNFKTRSLSLGVLFLIAVSSSNSAIAQKNQGSQREYSGPEASQIIPGTISLKEGRNTPFPAAARFSPETRIQPENFIPWLKHQMHTPDGVDFKLIKQHKDQLGMEHFRYVQTYRQVPIVKANYMMHVRDNRVVRFSGIALAVPPNLSPKPSLSEAEALKLALKYIDAKKYKWEDEYWTRTLRETTKNPKATYYPKGELCWNVGEDNTSFQLAYRFDIYSASPDYIQQIYIDANTGQKIRTVPLESNCVSASVNTVYNSNRNIKTENYSGSLYRLRDDCQGAKFHVQNWGSTTTTASPSEIQNTTNTWNNNNNERFGGTVLWLTERAYDYWLTTFTRNSYDGGGGNVNGYINAYFDCTPPPTPCYTPFNASMSFSGGTMKVGAGSGFSDSYATVDIIGHEYTHAVTGSESQLDYNNESGALNESFSDIFGEMNENFVFGSHDWLLGDERSSGYIRNMTNPKDKGQPDTYLGTNWHPSGGSDNGGVHTNSGVQNYWFYLLSVGGSGTNDNGDSYNVSGIGITKASAIAYQNDVDELGKFSTYADARQGAIDAAIDQFGACSNEVKQVTNAWHAVGVGDPYFDATASVTSNYNGRDVACHDACNGSAAVTIVSGVLPVITWSSPGNPHTTSVSGLCPGNYSVTVTNLGGLGCSVTKNITIQNPPAINAAPAATSHYNGYNISCNGGNNGTAAANASGGTPPYTYSWNTVPSKNTANVTGLSAGTYTVTVTDANGCSIAKNVTLTEPPLLTTTAAPTTYYNGYNVRCHGGSDGAAEAYPAGGVPPYSYSWNSTPAQNTKIASNLSATTYTVTVTDANGCTATANTTLTEPPQLNIEAGDNKTVYYGYPDSSCTKLKATAMGGGVPPYTISWSNGKTTDTNTVCPTTSTIYYVTLTDQNNCTFTDSVKVCVIDVRCGVALDKVQLCHNTGNPAQPHVTMCVALPAAIVLVANGDQLAACGTIKTCNFNAIAARYGNPGSLPNNGQGYLTALPNPFADYTTIRFEVPNDGKSNLKLYDLSGRIIKELFDGSTKAGASYNVRFDGGSIPAGVYFLVLKTSDGESYVSKLVVTK